VKGLAYHVSVYYLYWRIRVAESYKSMERRVTRKLMNKKEDFEVGTGGRLSNP
jgi:hypothetical protein